MFWRRSKQSCSQNSIRMTTCSILGKSRTARVPNWARHGQKFNYLPKYWEQWIGSQSVSVSFCFICGPTWTAIKATYSTPNQFWRVSQDFLTRLHSSGTAKGWVLSSPMSLKRWSPEYVYPFLHIALWFNTRTMGSHDWIVPSLEVWIVYNYKSSSLIYKNPVQRNAIPKWIPIYDLSAFMHPVQGMS